MTTYYKAVRPDGTDFYSGKVRWAPPEGHVGEWIVRHPSGATVPGADASTYLSVSTVETDCTGFRWPCRLFTVEPVDGYPVTAPSPALPNKRAACAWRVTGEVDAHRALGPQGEHVAALIDRAARVTGAEARALEYCDVDQDAWGAARSSHCEVPGHFGPRRRAAG